LSDNGFLSDVNLVGSLPYQQSIHLKPSQGGFWALDSSNVDFWAVPTQSLSITELDVLPYDYHRAGTSNANEQAPDLVVAPNSDFVARHWPTGAPELNVYAPVYKTLDTSAATASPCTTVLAWARNRKRLACLTGTETSGLIGIFDFDDPNNRVPAVVSDNENAYSFNEVYVRRRALSDKGEWLVFATTSTIRVVSLANMGAPVPAPIESGPKVKDTLNLDFSFSPDEQWLLEHHGSELLFRPLSVFLAPFKVGELEQLPQARECKSLFLEQPSSWCGNGSNSGVIIWSPNTWTQGSRWAVYPTTAGNLKILTMPPSGATGIDLAIPKQVNSDCVSTCGLGRYQFQP